MVSLMEKKSHVDKFTLGSYLPECLTVYSVVEQKDNLQVYSILAVYTPTAAMIISYCAFKYLLTFFSFTV